MGDIRAAYTTLMRFPGVGVIGVRWYFTDKPYLDKPHVYGPWRWFRENDLDSEIDDGQPGELRTYPWQFANGNAPRGLTCTGPRGTDAQWVGEQVEPLYPVGGYPPDVAELWDFLTMGG